jgi:hypothetical protein
MSAFTTVLQKLVLINFQASFSWWISFRFTNFSRGGPLHQRGWVIFSSRFNARDLAVRVSIPDC